jgi:hypothetical protein
MPEQNARSEIPQHFLKRILSAMEELTFSASREPGSQASRVDTVENNPSYAFLETF